MVLVGREEMLEIFRRFHRMYSGRPIAERRKEVEKKDGKKSCDGRVCRWRCYNE